MRYVMRSTHVASVKDRDMATIDHPGRGDSASTADDSVRLDKWLWAARFFKTRGLAADAVDGGKVHLNDQRVKRAKGVRVGDEVSVQLGIYAHRVTVRMLSEQRGPASVAATLYDELPESVAARDALRERRKLDAAAVLHDPGKPSKRDRRQINDLRRR
jgi:ribosome-associated heat shock protein Hsp15